MLIESGLCSLKVLKWCHLQVDLPPMNFPWHLMVGRFDCLLKGLLITRRGWPTPVNTSFYVSALWCSEWQGNWIYYLIMFIHFSPKPNRSNVIMINVWPCRRPCKSLNQNDSIISCLKPIKSNTNLMLLLCIDLSLRKLDWVSLIISVKPSLNLRSHK